MDIAVNICADLKTADVKREMETSDLKVSIDELKRVADRETRCREEMQLRHQKMMREKQAEIEKYRAYVTERHEIFILKYSFLMSFLCIGEMVVMVIPRDVILFHFVSFSQKTVSEM